MTFTAAIKTCFRKYVTFSGRASRSEFWWFAAICLMIFGTTAYLTYGTGWSTVPYWAFLVVQIPLLSATWRRLHDANLSAFHALKPFFALIFVIVGLVIPGGIIGILIAIFGLSVLAQLSYRLSLPSAPGTNTYDPNPHEVPS